MTLLLDFETRSRVDLRKTNAYIYAADPSTEILCAALKVDDEPIEYWSALGARVNTTNPGLSDEAFCSIMARSDLIVAHNAQFERLMWRDCLTRRFPGLSCPEISHWRCTAAQAAALALPRSLDQVCTALNLPVQKDKEGAALMLRMCKPRKDGSWIEDEVSLARLIQYCIRDVEAEAQLEKVLPPLSVSEQDVWKLDQEINDRGVLIDIKGCEKLITQVDQAKLAFEDEVAALTKGVINSASERARVLKWLQDDGIDVKDVQKGTVTDLLPKLPTGVSKRLLEIRQSVGLTSVAKLEAMARLASSDRRVRGGFMYHGATTGRWSGKGVQAQNLPRDSYQTVPEVEAAIDGKAEGCPVKAASRAVRGMIIAPPGKYLIAIDFSAIEARVLAWLARDEHILTAFRNNLDPYITSAADIYRCRYEQVTKEQRLGGKVTLLSLGFQSWLTGFQKMAAIYGADIGNEEQQKRTILAWRASRPGTVALWAGVEEAMLATVSTGKTHRYDRLLFGIRGIYLFIKLPNGRLLAYPYPEIQEKKTPYGVTKKAVTFMGVNSLTKKWERQSTYGGSITENCVSAIARDLLCEAMTTLDLLGLPIVMHAHDEVVVESETDILKPLESIFSQPPAWAPALPLAAEGWISTRYRK